MINQTSPALKQPAFRGTKFVQTTPQKNIYETKKDYDEETVKTLVESLETSYKNEKFSLASLIKRVIKNTPEDQTYYITLDKMNNGDTFSVSVNKTTGLIAIHHKDMLKESIHTIRKDDLSSNPTLFDKLVTLLKNMSELNY